jgi:hypothetical protein
MKKPTKRAAKTRPEEEFYFEELSDSMRLSCFFSSLHAAFHELSDRALAKVVRHGSPMAAYEGAVELPEAEARRFIQILNETGHVTLAKTRERHVRPPPGPKARR